MDLFLLDIEGKVREHQRKSKSGTTGSLGKTGSANRERLGGKAQ